MSNSNLAAISPNSDINPPESIPTYLKQIDNYGAKDIPHKASNQRFNRNLRLAKHIDELRIVCDDTGIVSIMNLPAIPGFALSYYHPLAELPNARGLAQQGKEYLSQLDTQVIAGILITMAYDYELFHYQPTDTGAQKNAILRTIQKNTLINAIELIERHINSSNCTNFPKLSLIMDVNVITSGLEFRMQQWLKLVLERVYRPDCDHESYDTILFQKKMALRKAKRDLSKQEILAKSILFKSERELAKDLRLAQGAIKTLYKQNKIKPNIKGFLAGFFQEYQILIADDGKKMLLKSKLELIGGTEANLLIEILTKDRGTLKAKAAPTDDFFDSPSERAPIVSTVNVVKKADTLNQEIKVYSIVATKSEAPTGKKIISVSGKDFTVDSESYDKLDFKARIYFHRSLLRDANIEIVPSAVMIEFKLDSKPVEDAPF